MCNARDKAPALSPPSPTPPTRNMISRFKFSALSLEILNKNVFRSSRLFLAIVDSNLNFSNKEDKQGTPGVGFEPTIGPIGHIPGGPPG